MKILFLTASAFGNTASVAGAMAEALASDADVKSVIPESFSEEDLEGVDILFLSSATQKFLPLPELMDVLKALPSRAFRGKSVAVFDTRFTEEAIRKVRILALFVKIFGYAAGTLAKVASKKGGVLIDQPQGFYVADTKGPLLDGELIRAKSWAQQCLKSCTH